MLSDTYIPKLALIVYECSDAREGLYLEQRQIENGQMGSGTPLTKKCVTDIMNTLAMDSDSIDYGLHGTIPSNLLYVDNSPARTKMVWYNPTEKRQMYFASSLNIPDGAMWVPGLLYIADGNSLRVYAFKGQKPKGTLYRAPFMNVGDDSVCLGNAKVAKPKDNTFSAVIAYWEQMFWMSEFSHILNGNPIDGNLATLSKQLIESGDKFPNKVLIPSKHSLKEFLR